jgi:hypothetical protein
MRKQPIRMGLICLLTGPLPTFQLMLACRQAPIISKPMPPSLVPPPRLLTLPSEDPSPRITCHPHLLILRQTAIQILSWAALSITDPTTLSPMTDVRAPTQNPESDDEPVQRLRACQKSDAGSVEDLGSDQQPTLIIDDHHLRAQLHARCPAPPRGCQLAAS